MLLMDRARFGESEPLLYLWGADMDDLVRTYAINRVNQRIKEKSIPCGAAPHGR